MLLNFRSSLFKSKFKKENVAQRILSKLKCTFSVLLLFVVKKKKIKTSRLPILLYTKINFL